MKAAKNCDVAVVVVGNHPTGDAGWAKVARPSYGKEAVDRQSINLEDEALIQRIYRANPRTVVVLVASFPYAINWTQQNVAAIVHITHNSQELGHALAAVLFGDYNPAGRLVHTWPRALSDLPPMMDYDLRKGRTYLYSQRPPLYPFGHGLSYTTFEYSNLRTSADALCKSGKVVVTVALRNRGTRAGEEVVQLYVRRPQSKLPRPLQELKDFARVALEPHQTKTVGFELAAQQLRHWDSSQQAFSVEAGEVELRVGGSSQNIALTKTIAVTD